MKFLFCGALCLFLGCGNGGESVVAEVGEYRITAQHLRTFVEALPGGLHTAQKGDAARLHYLQSLIDRRLLLDQALALGLDTTRALQEAVRTAVEGRVRTLYRAQHITSRVHVSEEEVRARFAEAGYERERKLNAILVPDRATIEAVSARLRAGQPFSEVARAHSLDQRSAIQGGELGFIGLPMALRLHIPADLFRSLPTGQVSPPLPAGRSWHVVLFSEDRPAPYEKYRTLVEEELVRQRLSEIEAEHLEELYLNFQVRAEPRGLAEIVDAFNRRAPGPLAESLTPLFTYDGGQLHVGRAWHLLHQQQISQGLADSAQALNTLRRLVLNPVLLVEAGRRAGLAEIPEIHRLARQREEDLLLETLRRQVVDSQVALTDAEVWEYYDSRPELFHHEEAVWAEELLLPSQAEALQARERIAAGANFADLAAGSLRQGAVEQKAHYHFHPREKGLHPLLVPALLQAPVGEVGGPLEVEGGFSVFRVTGRVSGGIEPYETAQRRARAMLYHERQEEALERFVKELRQKHAARIRIHESRLAEALPAELVGG